VFCVTEIGARPGTGLGTDTTRGSTADAVTVPVPTSHVEFGDVDAPVLMQAPPSWSALARRPGGSSRVSSLGESPPELVNERFSPRSWDPPALVPAL
jgi:hypothetical protein